MSVEESLRAGSRERVVLGAVAVAAFLAVLDGTLVTVALASLSQTFSARLDDVVWVTVSYLLAAAAVLPLLTWLTARWGPRRVFLGSLTAFLVTSALVGFAPGLGALIALRLLQGLAGGALEPSSLTLTSTTALPSDIGSAMGRMTLVINIAPVFGPLIGAALLTVADWSWLFWVKIPIGLVALVIVHRLLPADGTDRSTNRTAPARPDVIGMLLLGGGVVALLLAVNRIGSASVPLLIAVAASGLAVIVLYVLRARRQSGSTRLAAPFDVRLLGNRSYRASLMVMPIVGLTMFGLLTQLPLLASKTYGLNGSANGLLVSALGVGLLISMPNAGRFSDRRGTRALVVPGAAALAVLLGLVAVGLALQALPLAALMVLLVLVGLALGTVAAPAFSNVYRALPADQAAQGTTGMFLAVQSAASLGVVAVALSANGSAAWVFAVLAVLAVAAVLPGTSLPGRVTPAER